MKKFLKRTNRGLVLTGIVLFILIIYILVDYLTFSSQKGNIERQVSGYIDTVITSNLKAGSYGDKSNWISENISDYWVNKKVTTMSSNVATLTSQLDKLKEESDVSFGMDDATYTVKSISISKSGPNLASVQISYTSNYTGNPDLYILNPYSCKKLYEYYNDYNGYPSDDKISYKKDLDIADDSSDNVTCIFNCEVSAYITKVGGSWKICSWDGYINDISFNKEDNK